MRNPEHYASPDKGHALLLAPLKTTAPPPIPHQHPLSHVPMKLRPTPTMHPLGQILSTGGSVLEYGPNAELRHMEQIPPQNKGRAEKFLQHKVLPYAPDAWHGLEPVKAGHETSFNRHFHESEPMQVVERETGKLLEEIADGRRASMGTRIGGGLK